VAEAADSVKQSVHNAVAPSYSEQAKQAVFENTKTTGKDDSLLQQAKDAVHSKAQPTLTEQAKSAISQKTA
jgi:hypothetical protein